MSWLVALCALQAPADVVEPQDPDRPAYSLSDLKSLREANIFSPRRSSSRSTYTPRDERKPEAKAEPPKPKGLLVTGFIVDPATKTPRAILEDRNDEKHRLLKEPLFAKPGDEAQGWKVEEVAVDQVTISQGEERKQLKLGESFPLPAGAGAPSTSEGAAAPSTSEKPEAKPLEEGEKGDILERLRQKNKKKRSEGEP